MADRSKFMLRAIELSIQSAKTKVDLLAVLSLKIIKLLQKDLIK